MTQTTAGSQSGADCKDWRCLWWWRHCWCDERTSACELCSNPGKAVEAAVASPQDAALYRQEQAVWRTLAPQLRVCWLLLRQVLTMLLLLRPMVVQAPPGGRHCLDPIQGPAAAPARSKQGCRVRGDDTRQPRQRPSACLTQAASHHPPRAGHAHQRAHRRLLTQGARVRG